jgi:hypothetical protein
MNDIEIEARGLVFKFMQPIDELHKYPMCFDTAKQCALIAISLLFEDRESLNVRFWLSVKQEIEKL